MSLLLLLLSLLLHQAVALHPIIIVNKCPAPIDIYITTTLNATLQSGAQITRNFPDPLGATIYTTANGGNPNGVGATKANFFGIYNFTYILKDPTYFYVGVKISPTGQVASGGFCTTLECDTLDCDAAFNNQPHLSMIPPPQPGVPPSSTMIAQCPVPDVGYTVTFCPTGTFPTLTNGPVQIHPLANESMCADVRGAVFADGTPVQLYECNGTGAQKWLLHKYNTKVQLAGTNFCLDAGSNPANGVGMKIWQCFDNLPAQAWYWTDDGRIALTDHGLCLDATDGHFVNNQKIQTWQCTNNNVNQAWEVFNSDA